MDENMLYWIWLTIKPVMNPTKITCLWDSFDNISDIYNETEYKDIPGIGRKEIKALNDKSLDSAKKVIEETEKAGAKILTFEDINFPDLLRNIIDPPYVLYIKGEIMNWDRLLPIAVVGTRKPSDYGKLVTNDISRDMTKLGMTIVSGMARGIDAVAAWAALRAGGKTIAVLGSGIDVVYPPEHGELFKEICEHGAVITEYPPGSGPLKTHFPERNRIIAGMSQGVLVTEAPKGSGSLITARYAFDNGRDLFSVPSNIYNKQFFGNHRMIQGGAHLVMNAKDILEQYPYAQKLLAPPKIQVVIKTQDMPNSVTESETTPVIHNEQIISIDDKKYRFLNDEEREIIKLLIESNMHIDDIARKVEKSVAQVNTTLTMLEVKAFIKKLPGNNYKLKL